MSEIAHILYLFSPKDNISVFSLFSTVQLCNNRTILFFYWVLLLYPLLPYMSTQYGMKIVILEYNKNGESVISVFFINGKNIPNTA